MAYVAPLPFLLMIKHGFKWDNVTKIFLIFLITIIISGIINGSSLKEIFLFTRFIVTSYSMYYLASIYITHKNAKKIISLCITIGMIQLPVLILQRLLYDTLIPHSAVFVMEIDFYFGTFFINNDKVLSLFLTGAILFLLFDAKNNYFIKHRYFKAVWLTLSVFISNSIVSHLVLIIIWLYYFLRRFSLIRIFRFSALLVLVVSSFAAFNYLDTWSDFLKLSITKIILKQAGNEEAFFEGNYSRAAAIAYYRSQPIKLLGDGPSRYYDPITRKYLLGNRGQIFIFYSEIGLIGLLLGYLILYRMAKSPGAMKKNILVLFFISIAALTLTTSVLSNAGIMLAYNIFLRTNKITHGRIIATV